MIALRNIARRVPALASRMPAASIARLSSVPISAYRPVLVIAPRLGARRSYLVLSSTPPAKQYNYDEVKAIVSHPDKHPETVLVDVREPYEYDEGHIPGAVNIPFKTLPGALALSPEEFQEAFGFAKPLPTNELVFYCLGGVRLAAAEELASTFGYPKRGNYVGSWEDWLSQENQSTSA